jgi:Na+-driven multidrug efflux pump
VSGNIGVAAFGIITTLAFMIQMFFTGVGQGMQPIASCFYGKGISSKLKSIANYAVATNLILAVIVIAFVNLFATDLVSIFNPEQNAELANLAETGIRIYFMAFLPYGITMIAISFLSVTSSPTYGLVASFLQGGGIAIPLVLTL